MVVLTQVAVCHTSSLCSCSSRHILAGGSSWLDLGMSQSRLVGSVDRVVSLRYSFRCMVYTVSRRADGLTKYRKYQLSSPLYRVILEGRTQTVQYIPLGLERNIRVPIDQTIIFHMITHGRCMKSFSTFARRCDMSLSLLYTPSYTISTEFLLNNLIPSYSYLLPCASPNASFPQTPPALPWTFQTTSSVAPNPRPNPSLSSANNTSTEVSA